MKALKDPVAKVRCNAATSLGAFHPEAVQIVPALLELLSDDDADVRRATIVSLGMLGKGSEPAEQAVAKYIDDPDPATRMDAVVAAAAMGKRDDAVIPMLIEALGSKEEATGKAARKALTDIAIDNPEKIVPSLVATLQKKGDPRTVNAVRVLGSLRKIAAETAPQVARAYDDVEPSQRHVVVDTLLAIDSSGEQAIPILNKSLEASDSLDRREALMGLMRFRSNVPAILPSLIRSFNDVTEENRLLAVSIVRGLGEKAKAALPALLPMTGVPEIKIRKAAVGAIGSMRASSPEVIAVLEHTLADKEVGVRLASVYALTRVATVSPNQMRDQVGNMLQTALERETDDNIKQAIRSALLAHTPPPAGDQHSKLAAPEKHAKPEKDSARSQKPAQYK